ncbi:MAG: hypothetical protein OXH86_10590 [Acidimicrobiaceae bacterium]|nr:hypothetical protein [Acidimicrobiaceae bacterium]MDE0318526.1 hypothetical protein [Acidimicrobiaceae bacterium]MDE0497792.1 hypothetical protein [Acidimicrobiaceae bacterium]
MPGSDYRSLVDKSDQTMARMRRVGIIAAPLTPIIGIVLGVLGLLVGSGIAAAVGSGREIVWGIAFLLFALPIFVLVHWALFQALRVLLTEAARVRQGVHDCRWTGARALTAPLIGWGIPAVVAFGVLVYVLVMAFVALLVAGAIVAG